MVFEDYWASYLASMYLRFLLNKMRAMVIGLLERIIRCKELRLMQRLDKCVFMITSSEEEVDLVIDPLYSVVLVV